MFERFGLTHVDGPSADRKLVLLALSTCGFCKRAIRFLNDNGFSYSYIYVDKMEPEVKEQLKEEFRGSFTERLLYPALIINETEVLTGFIEADWKNSLGVA